MLTVRGLLRRYRSFDITAAAAAQEVDIGALQAQEFLRGLEAAGFIEPTEG